MYPSPSFTSYQLPNLVLSSLIILKQIPDILRFRDEIAPETKLIINGDIKDLTDVRRLSKQFPGVDGFMIGRGVFQNPYCFTNHQPTQVELEDLFLYHLDLFDARSQELESRGSRYPYEPIKHFIKVYFSGFDGASELRNRLMNCKTTEELRQIIQKD